MTRVSAAKEEQHAVLFVPVFIMAAICVGLGQVAKEGLWVWRKNRWGQMVKPLTSCKPFVCKPNLAVECCQIYFW
jgi:Ni/Fe-hydrogenase subunit HybB-like protein